MSSSNDDENNHNHNHNHKQQQQQQQQQDFQATAIPNETKWTDDRIRWSEEVQRSAERAEAAILREEADDESRGLFDIFKDRDPHETFSFRFETHDDDNDEHEHERIVDIELKGYKDSSDEIWQSTGLTLWKASEHLCRYLVGHRHELRGGGEGKRILELGAGLGLVGILAHRIVASSPKSRVVITDGDTEALVYLRRNVERNRVKRGRADDESNDQSNDHVGEVACRQLLWGRDTSLAFLERQRGEKFDVVLASDVVYSQVIIRPLWETVQCLLDPKGIFVFAYARREVPATMEDVLAAAEEAGFRYEMCEESDEEEGIYIYTFRWKDC
ncbi:hypothetical protein ACHAXS_003659 [Conticribra weissflogii]